MIAVNPEDHRVIDAWAVTDNDMEIEGRTCAEYLGIDINKYAEDVRKRSDKDDLNFEASFERLVEKHQHLDTSRMSGRAGVK